MGYRPNRALQAGAYFFCFEPSARTHRSVAGGCPGKAEHNFSLICRTLLFGIPQVSRSISSGLISDRIAGRAWTAKVAPPNGSMSNPISRREGRIPFSSTASLGRRSIIAGRVSICEAVRAFLLRPLKTILSWAACWSMITSPSGASRRMKEFASWPMRLRFE